ncbi:MAG: MFS transporter [Verrucomicrobiota bacterium]|nr:MFS transporter [Verrucomicrobiota bacterium]
MASPDKSARSRMGIIFLTLFIDLVGFSIIFPLGPSLLAWYLPQETTGSLLGQLVHFLNQFAHEPGEGISFSTTVLFGGVLASLYSLLQFACAPLWGKLSDRIGRRRVLIMTITGTAASYAIWVVSGSFEVLVISRILGGCMSGNIAVVTASVADITSRENRSKGMAIIGIAFGLGFIIGPAIGGTAALCDLTRVLPAALQLPGLNPFSFAAFIALALSVINLVWVWMRFEETLPVEKRRGSDLPTTTESRLSMLWKGENPALRRVTWVNFFFLLAFSGMEASLTFLATERLGYGPKEMVAIFVFIGLVLVMVQGVAIRRLAPRFGEKRLALVGLVTGALGLIFLAFAHGSALFYAGNFCMAVAVGLTSPTLAAMASLYSTEQDQGRDLGSFRGAGSLGRACGPLMAAPIYYGIGSDNLYLIGAVVLLVPLILAFTLTKPKEVTEG